MKVVVTGGAGFIGANLCRSLLARPEITEVVVVDDLSAGEKDNLAGLDVRLAVGTVLDAELLDSVITDAAAVVHLAAIASVPESLADPMASQAANATGTLSVLEAARRAHRPHVIVASSSAVYGANPELPKHEAMRCAPMSPYAVTKLATETYALAYAQCFELDVLPFRLFNVFGPLQPATHAYAAVIPAFVDAALRGEPLTVHGDGSTTRDFTFVRSASNVITDAVLRRVTHDGPVNLAFQSRTSLLELIELLEHILGRSVDRVHTHARRGDVPHSQADNALLNGLFPGLTPVPLEDGLRETVDWFRSQPLTRRS